MLDRCRDELDQWARAGLPTHLRAKLDPDDVVQDVCLRAQQANGDFSGRTDAEQRTYLKKALETTVADHIRRFDRGKRRAGRERSLDLALDESSARLQAFLAADQTSPSQTASRKEQLLRLAKALAGLPDNQRLAVEFHHLQGHSLSETAAAMGITNHAVAGLLRRGLVALRERLGEGAG